MRLAAASVSSMACFLILVDLVALRATSFRADMVVSCERAGGCARSCSLLHRCRRLLLSHTSHRKTALCTLPLCWWKLMVFFFFFQFFRLASSVAAPHFPFICEGTHARRWSSSLSGPLCCRLSRAVRGVERVGNVSLFQTRLVFLSTNVVGRRVGACALLCVASEAEPTLVSLFIFGAVGWEGRGGFILHPMGGVVALSPFHFSFFSPSPFFFSPSPGCSFFFRTPHRRSFFGELS